MSIKDAIKALEEKRDYLKLEVKKLELEKEIWELERELRSRPKTPLEQEMEKFQKASKSACPKLPYESLKVTFGGLNP